MSTSTSSLSSSSRLSACSWISHSPDLSWNYEVGLTAPLFRLVKRRLRRATAQQSRLIRLARASRPTRKNDSLKYRRATFEQRLEIWKRDFKAKNGRRRRRWVIASSTPRYLKGVIVEQGGIGVEQEAKPRLMLKIPARIQRG